MKKLCLVLYVYGEKYQGFIPLFLFSLFKLYPDYGVRIYLDGELGDDIKSSLSVVKNKDFKIIENFERDKDIFGAAARFQEVQRCRRWVFFDPDFLEYDAIYMGDVDIFFCPENEKIYEGHIRHSNFLGKPYSNIKREYKFNKPKPKVIARNFLKYGIVQTVKFFINKNKSTTCLTGLHFIKTKDYVEKVLPLKEEFFSELNLLIKGKSKKYNLCTFNNEGFLYDLMMAAGFGDLPDSTGKDYNVCDDSGEVAYRPHHGIHFGPFRRMETAIKESKMLTSDAYIGFYKYFCEIEQTEEYKVIEKNFSPYIKGIISNMHAFYKDN